MKAFLRLLFLLFFALVLESKPLEVSVAAKAAILINSQNGRILYEKNAFESVYPASITKIATALYALEKKSDLMQNTTNVSIEALKTIFSEKRNGHEKDYPPYFLETDGSALGLSIEEDIKIEDLLYSMMMVSGNDSANALAHALSGSIPEYMQQVNIYLKTLGCQKTSFLNPHGLHHPGHVTCAWDMALMTKKALSLPEFRKLVSTLRYQIPDTNKHALYDLKQTNRLMKKESAYYYPYAIGVKTGYHSHAGYTLVGAAENGERQIIAVLLGEEKNEKRYVDARKLFEAAFLEEKEHLLLFEKEQFFQAALQGGQAPLQAELRNNVEISFYPSEEKEYKAFIYWEDLILPIAKDEKVGLLQIKTVDGEVLATAELFSADEVPRTFWHLCKQWCFLAKKKENQKAILEEASSEAKKDNEL